MSETNSVSSETVTLRRPPAYHKHYVIDIQPTHPSENVYGVTDSERQWRSAILKGDYNEMSKILSTDPAIVNWRDYITGNTALHFAAQANDLSLVKLLVGNYKANVDARNHGGLTPLHLAALGASEEVAFALISQYNAKVSVRDYSGRLPVSYLPDTEAGRRLKSMLRSQYARTLEALPLLSSLVLAAPQETALISSKPPMAEALSPTEVTILPKSVEVDNAIIRPSAAKRASRYSCGSIRRKSTHRPQISSPTVTDPINSTQMVSRDDLPPTPPTRISGFATLGRRRTTGNAALQRTEEPSFQEIVYSTIRRRKSERGKNYNPMDPENQQTSFKRTPRPRTKRLVLTSDAEKPVAPPTPEMRPLVPRSSFNQEKK